MSRLQLHEKPQGNFFELREQIQDSLVRDEKQERELVFSLVAHRMNRISWQNNNFSQAHSSDYLTTDREIVLFSIH